MSTLARVCARIYALTLPVRWFVGAVSRAVPRALAALADGAEKGADR